MAVSRDGAVRRLWDSLTSPPSVFAAGQGAADGGEHVETLAPVPAVKPSPGPLGRPSAAAAELIARNLVDSLAEVPHPSQPVGRNESSVGFVDVKDAVIHDANQGAIINSTSMV